MPEQTNTILDSLKQPASWLRLPFMAAFVVLLYFIIAPVILVVMLVQVAFSLLTGAGNRNLRHFSAALVAYVHEILRYLTYNSEQKPFPFTEFPKAEVDEAVKPSEPSPTPAAAANPTRKKTAAKKTARKKAVARKSKSASNGSGNGAAR